MANPPKHKKLFQEYGFLVVANLFLACGYTFAHAAGGKVSLGHLLFFRSIVYLLVLLPWGIKHHRLACGVNRGGLVLRGVFGTAMIACMVYALSLIPLSTATILGKTTPIWSILILWALFAVPPIAIEVMLAPIAILGIVILLCPGGYLSLDNINNIGILVALCAGFFNSLEFITLRRVRQTDSANTINLWYAVIMMLVTLPIVIFQPWPSTPFLWFIALMFGVSTLAGQTLLAKSMRYIPPIAASVGTLLVPTFATLIAWVIFDQKLSLLEILGVAMFLVAGATIAGLENKRESMHKSLSFRWKCK